MPRILRQAAQTTAIPIPRLKEAEWGDARAMTRVLSAFFRRVSTRAEQAKESADQANIAFIDIGNQVAAAAPTIEAIDADGFVTLSPASDDRNNIQAAAGVSRPLGLKDSSGALATAFSLADRWRVLPLTSLLLTSAAPATGWVHDAARAYFEIDSASAAHVVLFPITGGMVQGSRLKSFRLGYDWTPPIIAPNNYRLRLFESDTSGSRTLLPGADTGTVAIPGSGPAQITVSPTTPHPLAERGPITAMLELEISGAPSFKIVSLEALPGSMVY